MFVNEASKVLGFDDGTGVVLCQFSRFAKEPIAVGTPASLMGSPVGARVR